MTTLRRIDKKSNQLKPVRPNLGVAAAYRRRLEALVDEMFDSSEYWIRAAFRKNPPAIAQDELPAAALKRVMRELAKRWKGRFDEAAPELAKYFAKAASRRSEADLKRILRRGGFSVKFSMGRAAQDIIAATVAANVSLIKSIPEQFLTQVEGAVMRSVQKGGDLESLVAELRDQHGVTKRRAALIAVDQNRKATAAITRARALDVGITQARWQHSGGGKEPRPTHVKASRDRVIYNVAEGWLDPAINKRIWPGTEINCRCVSIPILPGLA